MPIKSAVHFSVCDNRYPFSSFSGFDSVAAEAVAAVVAGFESAAAAAFLGVLFAVADAAVQNYGQKLVSAGTVGSPFFYILTLSYFFLYSLFLKSESDYLYYNRDNDKLQAISYRFMAG